LKKVSVVRKLEKGNGSRGGTEGERAGEGFSQEVPRRNRQNKKKIQTVGKKKKSWGNHCGKNRSHKKRDRRETNTK